MQLFSHPIPVLPTFSMDPFLKLPVTIRFLCLLLLACLSGYVEAHWKTLNIVNKCPTPIWPGIAPNAGHPLPAKGGFALSPGHNRRLVVPWTWQGRVWARTGCHFDASGTGSCLTGDCAGKLECNGAIGEPPATLAQFSFQPDGKPSYYDVSLVDGYNVPVTIRGGGGECLTAGCGTDINRRCPNELAVEREGKVVACKSGCLAFDLDRFCCRNEYATPATCSPSMYSRVFKEACPAAYSYAYDSPPPFFSCTAADFTVTFCPKSEPESLSWCHGALLRSA